MHTGTRTLQRVLSEDSVHHFCVREGIPIAYAPKEIGHIDFPVRNPLNTVISWLGEDRTENECCRTYENAINFLQGRDVTYHRMEDYPVLEGVGSRIEKQWSDERIMKIPEIIYLCKWLKKPTIKRFFAPFGYL